MGQKRPTKKLSDVPSINDIDVLSESHRTYSPHLTTGAIGAPAAAVDFEAKYLHRVWSLLHQANQKLNHATTTIATTATAPDTTSRPR